MIRVFSVPTEKLDATNAMVSEEIFKRNGYELRNAKGLGLEGNGFFLYVDGDKDFWDVAEELIEKVGLEALEGEELEKIQAKFDEQQDNTAFGVGTLFG